MPANAEATGAIAPFTSLVEPVLPEPVLLEPVLPLPTLTGAVGFAVEVSDTTKVVRSVLVLKIPKSEPNEMKSEEEAYLAGAAEADAEADAVLATEVAEAAVEDAAERQAALSLFWIVT